MITQEQVAHSDFLIYVVLVIISISNNNNDPIKLIAEFWEMDDITEKRSDGK